MLLEVEWRGAAGFRALAGGEAISRQLADALLPRVAELWNMYGPTETTVWSTVDRITADGPISIGRAIANTQIYILDDSGGRAPVSGMGEICIGGDGVALGYYRRPALTAERFVADPFTTQPGGRMYRTGDLGRIDADGKLYHLGRADSQVKIRGYRIELGEIESVVSAHEAVRQAAVVVRDAQVDDPRLVAYVIYEDGLAITTPEFKKSLREKLPDYMIPSMLIELSAMPLTPNGKVDRKALPNPFQGIQLAAPAAETPVTNTEQAIAAIWKDLLKVERIHANDNFFELGGYSLLSLRVAKMIKKRTGYQMDPRALFFNSLRQIAELVDAHNDSSKVKRR
jgi:acyl-coenzyme A synthetase/AMP-(fatty) acid ligase